MILVKPTIFYVLLSWSVLSLVSGQHLKFFYEQTTLHPNASYTTSALETKSSWQGYVGAVIAVVFFGSNFIPVKKFETGDGMFFQWVFCAAIWIAGLITNCIQEFPKFYPLAMLGGFLWGTGNICTVPIVKTIGLGLGLLIWGSFNLLSGWVSGRAVCWMFVKSQPYKPIIIEDDDDDAPLLSDDITSVSSPPEVALTQPWEMRLTTLQRRVIGVSLSIFSGILYGLSFTPIYYIKGNYPNASSTDLDYVFAHFCGIFVTSTIYFVIYCIIKKNRPKVYPSIILPAIGSGAMWAAADIGWFIANNYLSEAVSFPIITTGPGIIGSLWGVLVFHEIKGCKNYLIMGLAYTLTITGAVLAGLSKA